MPPKVKYSREAVTDAAYALAREGGLEGVNARAVAARLGCSTQPLFREFQSMDEIREAVTRRAEAEYARRLSEPAGDMPAYKASGMAYIRFAREEPQLFRMLFMCDRKGEAREPREDATAKPIIAHIMARTGMSEDEARLFHLRMWIFAHGLAAMTATHFADFTDEELSGLLSLEFQSAMALGGYPV